MSDITNYTVSHATIGRSLHVKHACGHEWTYPVHVNAKDNDASDVAAGLAVQLCRSCSTKAKTAQTKARRG